MNPLPLPRARFRSWLLLIPALALGLAAAYGSRQYLADRLAAIEASRDEGERVALVVAKTTLARGSAISPATVAVREVPRSWAHSGAITPEQYNRAEGATLAWPADAGEPLLWAQLEQSGPATFSALLQPGQRALTVAVDEINSVAGMIAPGDRIDLVVSVRNRGDSVTFPLLQNLAVLATGQQTGPADDSQFGRSFTTITVNAGPEEAKRIIAARELGQLTALLRAPGDGSEMSSAPAPASQLLGLATARPPLQSTVPVIYGGGPIAHGLALATPARADFTDHDED